MSNHTSNLQQALRDFVSHLSNSDADFALVGGLAVSARAEPRFTRELDVAVAVRNDEEAEAIINGLILGQGRPGCTSEQSHRERSRCRFRNSSSH